MKLGYTVWTWIIRLYEETHTWEPKSNRSKMDFEEAVRSIEHLEYESLECFNQIVDIYENADDEFDRLIEKSGLSFDCIYIYITDDFEADKQNAEKCFRFMQRHHIPFANLQASPRPDAMTAQALDAEIEKMRIIGRLGKAYGVTVCVHPHLDTKIERESEIDRLAQLAAEDELSFTFDTAHIHAADMDIVTMLNRHADRIKYIHLKDIADIKEMKATHFDRFRALGLGIIDFTPIIDTLKKNRYNGILCVEMDNPAICNFESAQQSRNHLKTLGL